MVGCEGAQGATVLWENKTRVPSSQRKQSSLGERFGPVEAALTL
jgi:hypothetical protein